MPPSKLDKIYYQEPKHQHINVCIKNGTTYTWRGRQRLYNCHVMRKPVYAIYEQEGADQTAHPQSLISAFVVRFLDCIIHILAKSKTLKALASLCIAEQAGLSLTLSQTPETGFIVTRLKIKISIAKDKRFF